MKRTDGKQMENRWRTDGEQMREGMSSVHLS